jgi:hypothetical protein
MLISQPGSDYQLTGITLDAGHTRDITLMLLDVHAVLDQLYLDGTQPPHHRRGRGRPARIRQPLHPARTDQRPRRGNRPAHPGDTPRHRRHPPASRTPDSF